MSSAGHAARFPTSPPEPRPRGGGAPLPVVDVLLPVRDAAGTLAEALGSVRRQTLTDFRCLVLDDGSTDDSPGIARAIAAEDPRFVVTGAPPRGLVATLNRGLEEARAPWLARLDADDLMAPERLERQVALAAADPRLDAVSCRVRFFGDAITSNLRAYEAWLNSLLRHEEIVRDLFVESPLPHPSVLVRTERLRELGGYRDNAYPEDYDLWLRAWRAGWRFGKVDAELVRIRDHPGRLTKTDRRYTARAFLECKAEHLVAARGLAGGAVVVWGAGRDGKRVARALRNRGVTLRGFVDIAPTKVGRRLLGTEVRPPESLCTRPGCLVVAAVGVKGARAEIREYLAGLGYEEGLDFVCCG